MGNHSAFYSREFDALAHEYPTLKPVFENEHWQLVGTLDVVDEFGKKWDQYQVNIIYPHEFPKKVPVMFLRENGMSKSTWIVYFSCDSLCNSFPVNTVTEGNNLISFNSVDLFNFPYKEFLKYLKINYDN